MHLKQITSTQFRKNIHTNKNNETVMIRNFACWCSLKTTQRKGHTNTYVYVFIHTTTHTLCRHKHTTLALIAITTTTTLSPLHKATVVVAIDVNGCCWCHFFVFCSSCTHSPMHIRQCLKMHKYHHTTNITQHTTQMCMWRCAMHEWGLMRPTKHNIKNSCNVIAQNTNIH